MTKNSYFGERALLFDEPRTATVEVSSPEAELWSIEPLGVQPLRSRSTGTGNSMAIPGTQIGGTYHI